MINAAQWIIGDAYISTAVHWILSRNRERIVRHDAKQAAVEGAAMAAAYGQAANRRPTDGRTANEGPPTEPPRRRTSHGIKFQ